MSMTNLYAFEKSLNYYKQIVFDESKVIPCETKVHFRILLEYLKIIYCKLNVMVLNS